MRRGIAIGVLVTALAGAGGAAWAQPGAGVEATTGPSWSGWVQGVQAWVVGLWTGAPAGPEAPDLEATHRAAEDPDAGGSTALEPPVGALGTAESCEPGFESCSADPNG